MTDQEAIMVGEELKRELDKAIAPIVEKYRRKHDEILGLEANIDLKITIKYKL